MTSKQVMAMFDAAVGFVLFPTSASELNAGRRVVLQL
jgi:hypothetical protein